MELYCTASLRKSSNPTVPRNDQHDFTNSLFEPVQMRIEVPEGLPRSIILSLLESKAKNQLWISNGRISNRPASLPDCQRTSQGHP